MTPSTAERLPPRARAAALAAAALLAACAAAPGAPAPSALGREIGGADGRVPSPLAPWIAADRADGARNTVLHAMHAGKAAIDIGALEPARRALDAAYRRIETLYADNEAAAQARSKFVPESRKDFKGEPYERAMVGYYLGLADLMLGDLDNARASFRWGEFQDTMSAAEKYQGDMGSLRFLVGWADHCQRRRTAAREAFRLAREVRPDLVEPRADDNLLVVVEAGPAPRKARSGAHGEALVYLEAPAPEAGARVDVVLGERRLQAVLAEDVRWQATTLGGRAVDSILAGKASFKDGAETVARTGGAVTSVAADLLRVGANAGDRRLVDLAGAGAMAGLLMSAIGSATAASTRAEADTRQWSNLPAALFIATTAFDGSRGTVPSATARAPAVFGAADGEGRARPIPGTGCHLLRIAAGAATPAWNPTAADAWMRLDDLDRAPTPATPARTAGDPDGAPAAPVKSTPVRASF